MPASNGRLYGRHDELVSVLAERLAPYRVGSSIQVPTDIILPSHDKAVVVVEGGANSDRYTVSDGRAVCHALSDQNISLTPIVTRAIKRLADKKGFVFEGMEIRSEPLPFEHVKIYITFLANVMRDCMQAALDASNRLTRKRLRDRIAAQLERIFSGRTVTHDYQMQGLSTDSHRFDFSVVFASGNRLLLDAPLPESGSIAATVLKHADLRRRHLGDVAQAITFDPEDRWPSSSLAQLQIADVPLIRAQNLEKELITIGG